MGMVGTWKVVLIFAERTDSNGSNAFKVNSSSSANTAPEARESVYDLIAVSNPF